VSRVCRVRARTNLGDPLRRDDERLTLSSVSFDHSTAGITYLYTLWNVALGNIDDPPSLSESMMDIQSCSSVLQALSCTSFFPLLPPAPQPYPLPLVSPSLYHPDSSFLRCASPPSKTKQSTSPPPPPVEKPSNSSPPPSFVVSPTRTPKLVPPPSTPTLSTTPSTLLSTERSSTITRKVRRLHLSVKRSRRVVVVFMRWIPVGVECRHLVRCRGICRGWMICF